MNNEIRNEGIENEDFLHVYLKNQKSQKLNSTEKFFPNTHVPGGMSSEGDRIILERKIGLNYKQYEKPKKGIDEGKVTRGIFMLSFLLYFVRLYQHFFILTTVFKNKKKGKRGERKILQK